MNIVTNAEAGMFPTITVTNDMFSNLSLLCSDSDSGTDSCVNQFQFIIGANGGGLWVTNKGQGHKTFVNKIFT